MPEKKRIFETDTLSLSSLHFEPRINKAEDGSRNANSQASKEEMSRSKEIVLRLIEWLEQK